MPQATTALTVGDIIIRQHEGLFSLNDLHQASGGEERHKPVHFLTNAQTKELVAESEKVEIPTFQTTKGRNGGTYACRELVIAYASWINAAFHLKVIRVFLDTQTPQRTPYSVSPKQALTADEADTLRLMLQTGVQNLPKEKQGPAMIAGWSKLKSHFKTGYRNIPRAQYPEALNIIARHVAELGSAQPVPQARLPHDANTLQDIACMAGQLQQKLQQEIILPCMAGTVHVGQRWIVTLAPDDQGAPLIALLQALDTDVIISRALQAAPQQRRALALAAYGGNARAI